jgi:hypothetical protein
MSKPLMWERRLAAIISMDGVLLAPHVPVLYRELPYILYIIARSTGMCDAITMS